MAFYTCTIMIFFLHWNTKEDILKNAGNQTGLTSLYGQKSDIFYVPQKKQVIQV